jgi:hypothetical protein
MILFSGPLSRGTPWERVRGVRVRVRAESRCVLRGRRLRILLIEHATTPHAPSPRPSPTEYRGRGGKSARRLASPRFDQYIPA